MTVATTAAIGAKADRFDRFRLIGWWDQEKLSRARVLVVGAGALGNEIVKNLALLGVGNVVIADMDRVEHSNLSRSVLYRESDEGCSKAAVAARAAKEIYPQMNVHAFDGNVVYDLGVGVFRWADIVLGGLDNREARLAVNRACFKVGRPWVDAAIEQIQGTVRLFSPASVCYECTMSAADWQLLRNRRSCNLLTRTEMVEGKTPTTPTVSSVIAGVQCQEAVKHLHGLQTIAGRGWVFDGLATDAYQVEYQRKPDCYSHDPLERVVELDARAGSVTVAELLRTARDLLGGDAYLEFARDVLSELSCPKCGRRERVFASLGKVPAGAAWCPDCGDVRREVHTFHRVSGHEDFLDRTAAGIGLPPMDVVFARSPAGRAIGLEFSGDGPDVLGPAFGGGALEWT
jgi:adenylyltransferase/sulfurtransferase